MRLLQMKHYIVCLIKNNFHIACTCVLQQLSAELLLEAPIWDRSQLPKSKVCWQWFTSNTLLHTSSYLTCRSKSAASASPSFKKPITAQSKGRPLSSRPGQPQTSLMSHIGASLNRSAWWWNLTVQHTTHHVRIVYGDFFTSMNSHEFHEILLVMKISFAEILGRAYLMYARIGHSRKFSNAKISSYTVTFSIYYWSVYLVTGVLAWPEFRYIDYPVVKVLAIYNASLGL